MDVPNSLKLRELLDVRGLAQGLCAPGGEHGTNKHDAIGRIQRDEGWHFWPCARGWVGGRHVEVTALVVALMSATLRL